MKYLSLITKEKLTFDKIGNLLLEEFNNKKIFSADDIVLHIGNYPTNIYIEFNNADLLADPDNLFTDSFIKAIPINDAYIIDVGYHSFAIIKRLVKCIYNKFPELWIYDDDFIWLGTAQEYLDAEYYKDLNYRGPNRTDIEF